MSSALGSSFRNPPRSPGLPESSRGPSHSPGGRPGWRSRRTGRGRTGQGGREGPGGRGVRRVRSLPEGRGPQEARLWRSRAARADLAEEQNTGGQASPEQTALFPVLPLETASEGSGSGHWARCPAGPEQALWAPGRRGSGLCRGSAAWTGQGQPSVPSERTDGQMRARDGKYAPYGAGGKPGLLCSHRLLGGLLTPILVISHQPDSPVPRDTW